MIDMNYSVYSKPSPCNKECPKRSATCHGTYEAYNAWVKEKDAYKAKINEAHAKENVFNRARKQNRDRYYREKKNGHYGRK